MDVTRNNEELSKVSLLQRALFCHFAVPFHQHLGTDSGSRAFCYLVQAKGEGKLRKCISQRASQPKGDNETALISSDLQFRPIVWGSGD